MLAYLPDEAATLDLGKQIAQYCPQTQFTIHLEGELGAGKTTLTRGLLRALGHKGNVKSPTYTLVEHYSLSTRPVFHFDLYRLIDPEELDYLGLDDYLSNNSLCLIEWASQGGDYLPKPDLIITLTYHKQSRHIKIEPVSTQARIVYDKLETITVESE
ncbi:tRNA (adenosine(37)-N6)-threonylcarbamoyltransferase complex ATPase subunit type 1 TsaE [Pseudomonadota bacterium]|nr:tRNA (adenosine(37)-N6)-threonylcarbamoyltransferase complex ATPase subunit type 1 TsaE [Pseudomonadota bacterium]